MKHREEHRLLKEILAGDEPSEFRQVSLDLTLASIRRRRRGRRLAYLSAFSATLVVLAVQIAFGPRFKPAVQGAASSSLAGTLPLPAPRADATVKFINDEQLLALFPDRSVALIGKPGHQRLVFLDGREESR